jgi:predicted flap endonuclease-1-like 5' DNA nuclease
MIPELALPLFLAVLAAAFGGWCLHCLRTQQRAVELRAERDRVRADLFALAAGAPMPSTIEPNLDRDREFMAMKLRLDELSSRNVELDRLLAEARGRALEAETLRARIIELEKTPQPINNSEHSDKIAKLELELEGYRMKAGEGDALRARIADLQAALDRAAIQPAASLPAPEGDVAAQKWRSRYLDARVKYLEARVNEFQAAPGEDTGRIAALERDLAAAQAKADELDAAKKRLGELEMLAAGPTPAQDELNRLKWRNRYLDARVRYLETLDMQPKEEGPKVDPEEQARAQWRARYMEARIAYLEGKEKTDATGVQAFAAAAGDELTGRDARIKELEDEVETAMLLAADVDPLKAKVEELELQLSLAKGLAEQVDPLKTKLHDLEQELDLTRDEAYQVAPLKTELEKLTTELTETRARLGELDTFRTRTNTLTLERESLASQLAAARDEIAALRARPQVDEAEHTRLQWQTRYLESRVAYLEERLAAIPQPRPQPPAPPPAPVYRAPPPRPAPPEPQYVWRQVPVEEPPPEPHYVWRQVRVMEEPMAPAPEPQYVWRQAPAIEEQPVMAPPPPPPILQPAPQPAPQPARYVWRRVAVDEPAPHPPPPPAPRERMVWQRVPVEPAPQPAPQPRYAPQQAYAPEPAPQPASYERQPPGIAAPRGGAPDDLRAIAGVGPKIEATLHSLGVFHFDQIARWTEAEIAWVDAYMSFRGRIQREGWVEQAQALARGEETEGLRRYLSGEHS